MSKSALLKSLVRWTAVLLLLVVCVLAAVFHKTLHGYWLCKVATWEEDAFHGKPVAQLEQALAAQGRRLTWCHANDVYAITGRELETNQRAVQFVKGKPYPWFRIGTAVNLGLVIIQEDSAQETVIEILRDIEVDSL